MRYGYTIKINFTGGIISPGDLLKILAAAAFAGVRQVSFGLRQQLFIEVVSDDYTRLVNELKSKHSDNLLKDQLLVATLRAGEPTSDYKKKIKPSQL